MDKKEIPFNRILIIDDSEVDFFIANTLLKRHKPSLSLYYAMDVDSALNMLREFKPGEAPDLILLDMNFDRQEKQGTDFLREFKTLDSSHTAGTKVVILTAHAGFRNDRTLLHEILKTEVIQKPFSVEKLMAY